MTDQINFSDYEYSQRKRLTKREKFLDCMDEITPWDEIVELIKPYYFKNKTGRPPRGIETMFRMYLLQTWYNLSDEGLEDAIYDSYAMRKFMHLDFTKESVPDATTLCKFRKIIVENGIAQAYFNSARSFLEEHGYMMRGGTIVDASLIDAAKSTKNEAKERDPEMHQAKKGNQWYFGAKLHVGVDAGSGYIHTVRVTSANVADSKEAANLIREDDEVVWGDSAYCALEKHEEFRSDEHLSKLTFKTNSQKPYRKNKWKPGLGTFWHEEFERQKSRVRCKVEYVFHIIKDVFRFRKTPYKGLKKLEAKAFMLATCANIYMLLSANPTLKEFPREQYA